MRHLRRLVAAILSVVPLLAVSPANADLIGHGGMVRAVAISPDGRLVLTGSFDYTARLWDFADQTQLAVLSAQAGPISDVAFLPDGKRGITASDDGTAIVWDLSDPKKPHPQFTLKGHKQKVAAVAVSPDGKLIATGSWDKTVRLWSAADGRLERVIDAGSPVNAVAFVDGGRRIAVGMYHPSIKLYDVATGEIDGTLDGHRMGITSLAVDPVDGNRLLSSSIDKTIRLWDIKRHQELRKINVHDTQVYSVVFTPDGKHAVTAGHDGYVIDWDLATGKPVREIKAHKRIAWDVAVTPDGRFAVSVSSDESGRVWHLGTGDRIGYVPPDDHRPTPWLTSTHPGAKLFTKCARCHALTPDERQRSGPYLAGLFGRKVGSVKSYHYSKALRDAHFTWNAKTLFELFHEGPNKMLPGTKMPVQRVTNDHQLTELVDYLKLLTSGHAGDHKDTKDTAK